MTTPSISARIAALRGVMQQPGVAACIVPTADPHLSEYLPEHWTAREWLSGFTGSAGTLVVTADFAGVWTDSRYFSQAERQLAGSGVELVKLNVPHTPEHVEWLCQRVKPGDKVACAADMLSPGFTRWHNHSTCSGVCGTFNFTNSTPLPASWRSACEK